MKIIIRCLFIAVFIPLIASAGDGYTITGRSGAMVFVSIDPAQKDNEDVYRMAVGDACRGPICQAQYWVGSAPSGFPLTDAQVDSKLVQWKQNQNTGLRRWLVNCDSSNLFADDRSCM